MKSPNEAEFLVRSAGLTEAQYEEAFAVALFEAGNPAALEKWFNSGAGGKISWGSPGDWQQCVDEASKHMTADQAHGFCELRHQQATGMSTSQHAAKVKGHK